MTGPHAETDTCDGHCAIHGVDEPGPGYLRCFECGHLYRTAVDLAAEYHAQGGSGLFDPDQIRFCPLCLHDF